MLNLFVGVITTAMDEANTRHNFDAQEDKKIQDYVQQEKIDQKALAGYRAAFNMMDLDNSGVLDEDEIATHCPDPKCKAPRVKTNLNHSTFA